MRKFFSQLVLWCMALLPMLAKWLGWLMDIIGFPEAASTMTAWGQQGYFSVDWLIAVVLGTSILVAFNWKGVSDLINSLRRKFHHHNSERPSTAQRARQLLGNQGIPWNQYSYIDYVQRGAPELVGLFWDGGIPIDASTRDGETVLHISAQKGNLDLLKEAIRRGADSNVQNSVGETPLTKAVNSNREHIVRELISRKVDLNSQTSTNGFGGCTALFFAALHGDTGIARQLLNAGARADLANRDGMTPLMAAALRGHPEVLWLLLNNGAEPTRTDQQGANALDYAFGEQARRNNETQQILSEAGLGQSAPKN